MIDKETITDLGELHAMVRKLEKLRDRLQVRFMNSGETAEMKAARTRIDQAVELLSAEIQYVYRTKMGIRFIDQQGRVAGRKS